MGNFDFQAIINAWPFLMDGLWFSVRLTAFAFAGGLVLGIGLALVRHLQVPILNPIVGGYITLMRSIPLILVLFWFFFLIPLVLAYFSKSGRPVPIGPTYTAFITFTLFEAAYYAEIIRTGLRSIDKGQYEASRALGLSTRKMYQLVILPQVIKAAGPIILTQTIILFQDTSLVYVMSITDLLGAAVKVAQRDSKLIEIYLATAVIYLVICSAAAELVAYLRSRKDVTQKRVRPPRSKRRAPAIKNT